MRPRFLVLALLAVVLLAAGAVWWIARRAELDALGARADDGLSLKAANVVTEANRFRYLPSVVGRDDRILRLLDRPGDRDLVRAANIYLESVNKDAGTHDLFLMDKSGMTVASSNWQDPDSRVGVSYQLRPYFIDALATGEGRFYAIGATGGIPGYFLARRIATAAGNLGVAVVKVDLSPLEASWRAAGEAVGLVDRAGMIFLSSVAAWKYVPLRPLDEADKPDLRKQYRPPFVDRPPLQPARDVPASLFLAEGGRQLLVRGLAIPGQDWRLIAGVDVAATRAAANRDAAIVLLSGGLLLAGGITLRGRRDRAEARRLRAVFEDMALGIAVFDAGLRLIAWNGRYAALNGYPAGLVRRGRPLAEIVRHNASRGNFGPGDVELLLRERIDQARRDTLRRTEALRPDGTWVEIQHARAPNGWVIRTYADITERKQAEAELDAHRHHLERLVEERTAELVQANERLQAAVAEAAAARQQAEEANRAKTRFLEVVRHEIGNPVTNILGYAGLVIESSLDRLPELQQQNLKKLQQQGRTLETLVRSFDYRRDERLEAVTFPLAPMIEDCLAAVRLRVDASRIRVASALPPSLPLMLQDREKLVRVLENLLSNAVKCTDDGSIIVSAAARDEMIEIAVADTGIGIATADHGRIFEPFQRAEPADGRPREGTGLGLWICRGLAGLMGGDIRVESRPGQGSTFVLSVPVRHPAPGTAGVPPGALPPGADHRPAAS